MEKGTVETVPRQAPKAADRRWAAAEDLGEVRCVDEVAPRAQMRITAISACAASAAIRASGVPLLLTAGWLDSTAGPAICIFTHAARAPGAAPFCGYQAVDLLPGSREEDPTAPVRSSLITTSSITKISFWQTAYRRAQASLA